MSQEARDPTVVRMGLCVDGVATAEEVCTKSKMSTGYYATTAALLLLSFLYEGRDQDGMHRRTAD